MNDGEWLKAAFANNLLAFLRPWRSHKRRLILYVCAWYRQHWKMLNEPCRTLIERCEFSAYGKISPKVVGAAKRAVQRQAKVEFAETGHDGLADVGPGLLRMLRLEHLPGWEGVPPPEKGFIGTDEQRLACVALEAKSNQMQVDLLRDIFPNPFRPTRIEPDWLTGKVQHLAWAAIEQCRLPEGILCSDKLVALAHALESVGCANPNLLGHLRETGPHVRGCWAVDFFLMG